MRPRGNVRPLDTPRLTAASTGVARQMGDVLNHAGSTWEPRLLANLYAAAALEADDAHAEEHDLLSQHYAISKTDLLAVIHMAEAFIAIDTGDDTSDGAQHDQSHRDCQGCRNVVALGHVRAAVDWTSAPGWDRIRRRQPEESDPAPGRPARPDGPPTGAQAT